MTLTFKQLPIFVKALKTRCHASSLAKAAVTAAFSALALQMPAGAAEVGVTAKSVTIGQSISLSGPLGAIGTDYGEGFKLAIDDANRRGGVHGRKMNLIQLDDAYLSDRALVNTRKLLDEDGVFAIVGSLGTGSVATVLPLLTERRVPLFAAFTGADSLRREPSRYLFTVIASYGDETEKMVNHLTTIGIKNIGAMYQNNAFGKDGLAGAEAALKRRGLSLAVSASVETNASDAGTAAKTISAAKPQAVLVLSAGKATIEFARVMRKSSPAVRLLTLSVADTNQLVRELGKDAAGVVVAQTMPAPVGSKMAVSIEHQKLMKAAGKEDHIGYASMTGFVAARAFVQALKLAGTEPTRDKFISGLESGARIDVGGFELRFSPERHHGSTYVELTMIRSGGSLFAY